MLMCILDRACGRDMFGLSSSAMCLKALNLNFVFPLRHWMVPVFYVAAVSTDVSWFSDAAV